MRKMLMVSKMGITFRMPVLVFFIKTIKLSYDAHSVQIFLISFNLMMALYSHRSVNAYIVAVFVSMDCYK